MHFAWWITKAEDTHSGYVIIITGFPRQQWLHERTSMLCYTYIACLVGILWCNSNGICVIIHELALSKINEIRSAVILQKKHKGKRRDRAHSFLHAARNCHGHSFVIICIHGKSIPLEITNITLMAEDKNILSSFLLGHIYKYSTFFMVYYCIIKLISVTTINLPKFFHCWKVHNQWKASSYLQCLTIHHFGHLDMTTTPSSTP